LINTHTSTTWLSHQEEAVAAATEVDAVDSLPEVDVAAVIVVVAAVAEVGSPRKLCEDAEQH
jgi:hypothetical protein